jgi:hypothetical protein
MVILPLKPCLGSFLSIPFLHRLFRFTFLRAQGAPGDVLQTDLYCPSYTDGSAHVERTAAMIVAVAGPEN